ncbi:MAG: HlyD family efflux transporter periplasmic adaptor subunit [Planctomycetota bacterium]
MATVHVNRASVARGESSVLTDVTRLAQADLSTEQFYSSLIERLPVPFGTIQRVAWLVDSDGDRPRFRAIGMGSDAPLPLGEEPHSAMLLQASKSKEATVLTPPAAQGESESLPIIVIAPLVLDGSAVALVEVLLQDSVHANTLQQFVGDLERVAAVAVTHHARQTQDSPATQLAQFTNAVHRSRRTEETCYAIANEARRMSGYDRVSVLVRRGQKYSLKAVSGQESIHRRSNLVKQLERFSSVALKVGEPFWFPSANDVESAEIQQYADLAAMSDAFAPFGFSEDGASGHEANAQVVEGDGVTSLPAKRTAGLAPQVEAALNAYLDTSHCLEVGLVPLYGAPAELEPEDQLQMGEVSRKPVGALVFERLSLSEMIEVPSTGTRDFLCQQSGLALCHAQAHDRIFLLPLWRRLGDAQRYFYETRRKLTISLLVTFAVAVSLLCFVPAPFHVTSPGQLVAMKRGNAFAPMAAVVQEIHVRENETVAKGQPLLTLRSPELDLEMQRLGGEERTLRKGIDAIRARRLVTQQIDDETAKSLQDDAAREQELLEQLRGIEKQMAIRERMQETLVVKSPIAGRVVTWDIENLLENRPVNQGQLLLEVVDAEGGWILELEVPDRKLAHVLHATKAESPMPVTYLLASDPSRRFQGELESIEQRTNTDGDQIQFARARVEIDAGDIRVSQPGTEVQARLDCGQRPLGYVWFHSVWEYVQARILFRIW